MHEPIDWLDTTPKPMACTSPQSVNSLSDEGLERLIAMTNQTNLVALDKTLAFIRSSTGSYGEAAKRCNNIAYRMVLAIREVGLNLPSHQRARV